MGIFLVVGWRIALLWFLFMLVASTYYIDRKASDPVFIKNLQGTSSSKKPRKVFHIIASLTLAVPLGVMTSISIIENGLQVLMDPIVLIIGGLFLAALAWFLFTVTIK